MNKNTEKKDNGTHYATVAYRTVKIKDDLHHRLRTKAVADRMPMQTLIERLLEAALRETR